MAGERTIGASGYSCVRDFGENWRWDGRVDSVSATKAKSTDGLGQYGHRGQLIDLSLDLRYAQRVIEQLSVAAQSFVTQLDFQKLLADIVTHAHAILPAGQIVAYSNVDGTLLPEAQFPRSNTLKRDVSPDALWCVRYLKPKVTNTATDGRRNSICVPFVASQNRVLGVVEFRNKKTSALFTENDVRAALCFARVATTALDRARLFFRIEEWKQSIETLLSFNATVNQHLEPEEMVRELVTNVTGFLDADGGMAGIAIRSDSGVELHCDGFYFANLWSVFARTWRTDEGIPGTVLETQFPYLSSDYKTDALREPELCRSFDLGSCICVPIKNLHEEVLGFFQLHRRAGEPDFTWQDAAFLETLGNTAAVAIENARLVKSLELKTETIKSLSQDHVRRLEEERRHIARELHDETGQVLIGLKLRLQLFSGLLTEDQAEAKEQLVELRNEVNNAAVQLRTLAKKLRPPTLDELDFEAAIRQLISEFRRHVTFTIRLDFRWEPKLSGDCQTALYRIVQECLTNITKHAGATQIEISFEESDNQQLLRIVDDGMGFDLKESTKGLGLVGMKERVAMLGGRINVVSCVGEGTTIEVILMDEDTE